MNPVLQYRAVGMRHVRVLAAVIVEEVAPQIVEVPGLRVDHHPESLDAIVVFRLQHIAVLDGPLESALGPLEL